MTTTTTTTVNNGAHYIDAFALASSPPRSVDAMMMDADFGGSPARPPSSSHAWDEPAINAGASMAFAASAFQPSAATPARLTVDGAAAAAATAAGTGGTMSVGSFGIAPPGESLRDTLLRGSAASGSHQTPQAAPPSAQRRSTAGAAWQTPQRGTTAGAPAAGAGEATMWVTVFGFRPEQAVDVVHHFAQYGEILHHQLAGDNFMHIQFGSRLAAQQALSKNGRVFFGSVMLGIVPYDAESVPVATATMAATPVAPRRAVGSELTSAALMRDYSVSDTPQIQPQSSLLGRFVNAVFGV